MRAITAHLSPWLGSLRRVVCLALATMGLPGTHDLDTLHQGMWTRPCQGTYQSDQLEHDLQASG
jgi:hypothetical protein